MAEITVDSITTGSIKGTGVFDKLMESVSVRMQQEYAKNRIKGTEYSKVFLGAMEAAMQQSIAFELGRQQADKQAELLAAQKTKVDAEENLITYQRDKVHAETELIREQKANTITQGVILDDEKLISAQKVLQEPYNTTILTNKALQAVTEGLILNEQVTKVQEEIDVLQQQDKKLIEETKLVLNQASKVTSDIVLVKNQSYTELAKIRDAVDIADGSGSVANGGLVGKQTDKLTKEILLIKQKKATEEAQVNDTVTSWDDQLVSVVGVIGKQKELYEQQRLGFIRDSEQKIAKIMVDSWSVRRSTDEATTPTGGMTDPDIQEVLNVAKLGIGAGGAKDPIAP